MNPSPAPSSGFLLTQCPACWPPCGAGTSAGPVGRAGEGKGREEGVKFPPTSFSSSHVPWPPLSWWHNGHSDGKELEPAPGTSGNTS